MSTQPRRVLIVAPNWLGDAVLAIPAVRAVRRAWPTSHLAVLTRAGLAEVWEGQPGVDEVVVIPPGGRWGGWRAVRAGRFDQAVILPNSFGSAARIWAAGVPARLGYATDGRRALLTGAMRRPATARRLHQAEEYLQLVEGVVGPVARQSPTLVVSGPHRAWAGAWLDRVGCARDRPVMAVTAGARYGGAKRWPIERFGQVVGALQQGDPSLGVLVMGTAQERREVEPLLAGRAGVWSAVGETTVGQLVALVERCALVLTNDSGVMHVASAVGRPVVAVFGPTDAARTGPMGAARIVQHPVECSPCWYRECPLDHRCMRRVTVEEVVAACRALLKGGMGPQGTG